MYQVTTESDNVHYVRINVVFHRYLTKVEPDYKIKGIREVPERSISGLRPPSFRMEERCWNIIKVADEMLPEDVGGAKAERKGLTIEEYCGMLREGMK